jgi:hypothetical protein
MNKLSIHFKKLLTMQKLSIYLVTAIAAIFTSCGLSDDMIITLSKTLPYVDDNYTIVWVGKGESYVYKDGKYIRSESNDYTFEVVQRRYHNVWRSVKNMHRIHPDYDGKAGDREQTMYFTIMFTEKEDKIVSKIKSSLGNGDGVTDNEFRKQTIQFSADGVSSFAPYNTYRITQNYQYEEGLLLETVELFKLDDGKEIPFVKIEEKATIFRPVQLDGAPTLFKE